MMILTQTEEIRTGCSKLLGLQSIRKAPWFDFVSSCIPFRDEITRYELFEPYNLSVKPRYRNILGTMVDYGVRSRYERRCYSNIEIGLAKHNKSYLSHLVKKEYLDYLEAYTLATGKEVTGLSSDIACDYAVLVERCDAMVRALKLDDPLFGAFYDLGKSYKWIEADCITQSKIIDIKTLSVYEYRREYWEQVLTYSLIAKSHDGYSHRHLILLYPVQGFAESFVYERQDYEAMYKAFVERSGL